MSLFISSIGFGLVNGPDQANLDIAISKVITFDWPHEKTNLIFRAEFYNAFNHPQFSGLGTSLTNTKTFGTVTGAQDPRMLLLVGRFRF